MMLRTPRQRLRLLLLRLFARLTRNPGFQPGDAKHTEESPPQPARILVIRPDHLGDLLFTTPALRALRQRYPDAHITALVGPWGATVLSNNPQLDEIISLPFPAFSRQPKASLWQPYRLLFSWARQLRGRFDLAFVLRFDHWWGTTLAYLARVPRRVGYAMPECTPFLSDPVPYVAGRHEVAQNLSLVLWDVLDKKRPDLLNGPRSKDHPLEFHIPEQANAWVGRALPAAPLIAIHPGAGAAIKLWQVERWAAVGDALAEEMSAKVLLTGAQDERALCLEIAARMKHTVQVMAGETTLDQLAALLSRCRLVLGPDSGPLHLAVALGTPTVHLYGPVDPTTFGPWGLPERHAVITSAWPCIPCNRLDYGVSELAHHPCVREIPVDAVLAAARHAVLA